MSSMISIVRGYAALTATTPTALVGGGTGLPGIVTVDTRGSFSRD
jgi:hypothetical protein